MNENWYLIGFLFVLLLISSCVKNTVVNDQIIDKEKTDNKVAKDELARCNANEDCIIVNEETMLNCCRSGCDEVDYSLDNYIAVNGEALNKKISEKCYGGYDIGSSEAKQIQIEKCGPVPGCSVFVKNGYYEAKCITGACKKVLK